VLSIAKLTPGQERYYEQSVAAGLDDYYAGRGESPGVWVGRGATELELDGVIDEGQLGRLIGGRHPVSSAVLRGHPPKRRISVERIEAATGRRWLEQKTLAPVAGFDFVFSVPKSVSLLHALGDEQTRLEVVQAHDAAWRAALAYLEEEACVLRRGKNGVRREAGGGFIAAAYQHRTSRAQDPHLHTHVIVANLARSASDGEWRALDGEAILKSYRLAAGYLYEAQLRYELSHRLGVEWAEPEKGWAELKDVPRAVIDGFSRRRAQVVEHLAEQSTSGLYAAKVAAVATRERKEEIDLPRLREEWAARAAEHGLGRRELQRLIGRTPHRHPRPAELLATMERLLGPKGLTEKRTAFSEPELAMAWAEAHNQGVSVERVRELCGRLLEIGGVQRLSEPAPGRSASYSTLELLELERRALELVERGRSPDRPAASSAAPKDSLLSVEQAEKVRAVVSSRDRVICVVGPAGSGKTTAMHEVATTFRAAGLPVLGAAPSGIAAERLQDETGVPALTLHRLLAQADGSGGLPEGCVLIVDEAAMAETRVLAPILHAVERAEGRAILIGDPLQLPAVAAGGLFAAIVERHGAIELRDNQRQREERERRALEALRTGRGRDYLAFADDLGRLVVSSDPGESRARLLGDWWRHAATDLAGNVMLANRRADVAELNALARTLMEREGRLGAECLIFARREFRAGDRILCRRNSDTLGVRNGTRGTVSSVEPKRGTLVVETDRGNRVELSSRYLQAGHVEHAYSLTGHMAQGLTVERAFVLGSTRGRLQEWGYVALSRASEATRLYVTGSQAEPDNHFWEVDDRDPLTRLAQALETSGAEVLAQDTAKQKPRAESPSRPVIVRRSPAERELEQAQAQLRTLTAQEQQATQLLRRAEHRLAEIKQRLAGLGWRDRRRHRSELERERAFRRSALRSVETRLAELGPEKRQARQRVELAAAKLPAREPEREQSRGIEPRGERQQSLDLGL
jgi:conjugative relaxase-like TrwC/TraI family protein